MSEPRRSIKRIGVKGYKIYEVDSEPREFHRYQFIIYNTARGYFYFTGLNGGTYPRVLSIVNGINYDWSDCKSLAAIEKCTPHTIKECIAVAEIISAYKEGE